MRAMVLDVPAPIENHPLRMADVPTPEPAADEVLIEVHACGVCRTDLHVVEGDLEVRRSPIIPGHQIVGQVERLGSDAKDLKLGDRVGVAWLHRTCGRCAFCKSHRENLCDSPDFTGWTVHGGFAEYVVAPTSFTYRLPESFPDLQAAPLLCAGIIGYRCLRKTGIEDWSGARLGLYGFGAAGHVAIQIARARGADVYVCTRDREKHQALAEELGAAWTGGAVDTPPVPLDAGIVFAPAGEIVPAALSHLDKGGTLVLGGIHMSPIPELPYELLYRERVLRSVANNTRDDGHAFLKEAAEVAVRTRVETFPLENANEALERLRHDGIRGAAVLTT
ncbi:MAG: zinc-dependent alcohol dehydrogenase family protein [Myxococcales bacterium]|nr:zinc-dependent alcohol dehydrogenase family protein [Myxococcales bacterium]